MDTAIDLFVSVTANVIGFFLCKWLDRHTRGR